MRDFGYEAQKAAEKHLDACERSREEYEELGWDAESPASAPYCGCQTCALREVLHAAWPSIYANVKDDFFSLLDSFIVDEATDDEGTLEGVLVLKRFRQFATELCWSADAIDYGEEDPSADGVGAEQEDEPGRDGDGDQGEVTGSECHVVKLPRRSDVQA